MFKISKKIILLSLISLLSTTEISCGKKEEAKESKAIELFDDLEKEINDLRENIASSSTKALYELEKLKELIDPMRAKLNIVKVPVVVANRKIPIQDNIEGNGKIIGYLLEDQIIKRRGNIIEGFYEIEYYGMKGYVDALDVQESILLDIDSPFQKVVYATAPTTLTIPDYLSSTRKEEKIELPALESFEILEEEEEFYVARTTDYIGYIPKENLEELTGTFVIVDISSQELKIYQDNEIILKTPVVTGKKSTPSDEGLFAVYNITYNRYLVGPGYRSYVNVMMKYNGGEGLHDAEYYIEDNGFKHGWRDIAEFGSDTYITDGSHGCVNMPHDAAIKTEKIVDIGTLVLVKP